MPGIDIFRHGFARGVKTLALRTSKTISIALVPDRMDLAVTMMTMTMMAMTVMAMTMATMITRMIMVHIVSPQNNSWTSLIELVRK